MPAERLVWDLVDSAIELSESASIDIGFEAEESQIVQLCAKTIVRQVDVLQVSLRKNPEGAHLALNGFHNDRNYQAIDSSADDHFFTAKSCLNILLHAINTYPGLKLPLENRPGGLPRRLARLHGIQVDSWPADLRDSVSCKFSGGGFLLRS